MSRQIIVLICLLCGVVTSKSARILAVYPTPSISHQVVFRPLTLELAKRGHEIIVLTPDPAFPKGQAPKNLKEIDVHDMSYELWRKHIVTQATGNIDDLYKQSQIAYETQMEIFHMQLNTSEFKKIIDEKQQFDLLLLEAWLKPTFLLTHWFKAPVIQVSSLGPAWSNYENLGAPEHPLLSQPLYNLTLWEKMIELYSYWEYIKLFDKFERDQDDFIKRTYGSDTPSLRELSNNIDMLFLNIHPIFEGNPPWPPGIISIWGIHTKPEKPLPETRIFKVLACGSDFKLYSSVKVLFPVLVNNLLFKDLQSYLDSSKHGVIYVSFGTNADPANLHPEKIQTFVKVFSKLPYDILWKWNHDILPGKTENIKISKWLPQSDLLRHPKIKLFITQGGLQSTDEAIVAGVPLVGIPMLGDQFYNVIKYVHLGIGQKLDIETITEEALMKAVTEVIGNEW
ncbi:UDP-glucoronosyl and UDP-glucosyl transferase domain-containing protein [Phthorimaea operculella]|nr:UDP-glucoronosyl and UDP-glucosyl transferase domain-containing protein [Phthorimaea operculella]